MKKNFVARLAFALLLSVNATVFSAANPFSDVPADHWAYNAVTTLAVNGINEGYGDATFRGDRNITRYEVATMLARMPINKFESPEVNDTNFSDLPKGHWAYNSVMLLSDNGISQGYGDGSFRGDQNITRYEMVTLISKLISEDDTSTQGAMPFMDVPEGHWASEYVKTSAAKGLIEGYGDGTFRGDRNITRYETAMILAKVMASI